MNLSKKKILITGGCGFIGSHLIELLQSLKAEIRVFVRYTSTGSLGNLSFIPHNNLEIIYGDLRNPYIVREAMKNIDIVFHLASLISIPYSYINPTEYFDVNIKSILNILQAARDLSTELIIHTSTSEVYGTAEYVPIDENHPLQGQSPYSASKIAADKVVESFFLSYDSPVITIRPFNTYGPRQSTRAVIPTIINQLLKSPDLNLGDLTPTRDFLFVKDTASSFVVAAEKSDKLMGKTLNVGTGREISIQDLVGLISRLLNIQPNIRTDLHKVRPKNSEVKRLCCNPNEFIALTDWRPKYTLEQGLKETIAFYREFEDNYNSTQEFI